MTQNAGINDIHQDEFAMDADEGHLGVGQPWGDYGNDGWVDLFVTGNLASNVLYRNQQDGTLAESEWSHQLALLESISGGAVWAEYDNDG